MAFRGGCLEIAAARRSVRVWAGDISRRVPDIQSRLVRAGSGRLEVSARGLFADDDGVRFARQRVASGPVFWRNRRGDATPQFCRGSDLVATAALSSSA